MQVHPIKPTLKAHGTKRLNLKFDILLSNFAFTFNLRRYNKGWVDKCGLKQVTSQKDGYTAWPFDVSVLPFQLHFIFELAVSGSRGFE